MASLVESHLSVRPVLLDSNVSLLGVPDVQGVDLAVAHLHRGCELAMVINIVVTIDLPICANKLPCVMVGGFSHRGLGIDHKRQT
jgi:hypothetical protein